MLMMMLMTIVTDSKLAGWSDGRCRYLKGTLATAVTPVFTTVNPRQNSPLEAIALVEPGPRDILT